jgi:hypothetical protein
MRYLYITVARKQRLIRRDGIEIIINAAVCIGDVHIELHVAFEEVEGGLAVHAAPSVDL